MAAAKDHAIENKRVSRHVVAGHEKLKKDGKMKVYPGKSLKTKSRKIEKVAKVAQTWDVDEK